MTRTLFAGGSVFDGTGSDPAPADVLVEEGLIAHVGSDFDADEVVDCAGTTVLPGLIDSHVHVLFSGVNVLRMMQTPFSYPFYEAVHNLRTTLETGITNVRDASGADLGVAQALRDGLIAGPRVQISISMVSQTGGHGDGWQPCGSIMPLLVGHPGSPSTIVDGPDSMRRVVRELVRAGADVIKVATSGGVLSPRDDPRHGHFRDAEIAVLVEEATAAGLFVMAHAQATDGIKVAIRNGVRSIEHGIYLDDQAIEMMLAAGTWLVPTLSAPRAVLSMADSGVPMSAAVISKARMVLESHDDSVRRAIAAGVKIATGTDSGVGPHGDNLDELGLMTDLGMTAAQAWRASTASAAELLGISEDFGTLEPGKRADVVVLEGATSDLVGLRERIRAVYQDGVLVAGVRPTGDEPVPRDSPE
ncbi:MAG: amidohydrolase family protein [Geodermatophilaceae bacterium]